MSSRVHPSSDSTRRERRRQEFKIHLTASDMWELQKTRDNTKTTWEKITPYVPILSWALWLLEGSLFYAYHDNFGIVYGFYQSVNIGWSMGWVTPIETDEYLSLGSTIFSTIHTSIGVMFVGIAVIYIAKEATESKDNWMMEVVKQDKLIDAANTEGIWDDIVAAFDTYGSKYKIILFWVLWLVIGLIFGVIWIEDWDSSVSIDFVLSSVSGAGYLSLPGGSSKWKYFFTAFYTAIGMPITSISIGLIISFMMITNDTEAYYEAICSTISDKELEFMKMFGIDDGDGTIDNREFIILIAVRFGSASPGLLAQINERFQELDRDRTGYIKYNDLIKGRRERIVKNRFKNAIKSDKLKLVSLLKDKDMLSDKKAMYSVKSSSEDGSECVSGDKFNCEERSVESGGIQMTKQHGDAPSTNCDDAEVREFRASSIDDVNTTLSTVPNNDKNSYNNESKDNVCMPESMEKNTLSESNKIKTNNSQVVPGDSFYSVTKAAQLWKKKSDIEANTQKKLSTESGTDAFNTAQATTLDDTSKEKKVSRRQTYISRSDSIKKPTGAPIKKYSLRWLFLQLQNPMLQSLFLWFAWLLIGTIFYAVHEERELGEAVYYSISVGYGIFWLTVEDNVASATFTRIHFCLGMIAIGIMMAAFASVLVDSKTKWYVEAMKIKALEEASNTEGYWDDIVAFFTIHGPKLKIHIIFILWVIIGVFWSCLTIEWPLIDGIYFSVSALTTGGLWPIPEESPAWYYAFVAFFVVLGVPVMAISLGLIANSVSNIGGSRILDEKISARITDEEIDMMESFGIVDDDGSIDAKEFAILTLVRIGALQPSLICMIHERFEEIDEKKTGSITYDALKNFGSSKMTAYGKNLNNKNKHVNRKLGFS